MSDKKRTSTAAAAALAAALACNIAASQSTERVSVATGGAQATWSSYHNAISSDGRFVAFDSFAPNLVAGDTNGSSDVFVRDRQSGTTERVSLSTSGAQWGNNFHPSISGDGRFVAFWSDAPNYVTGDTNDVEDVFVRDRMMGTTERVSVSTSGAQGNAASYVFSPPTISADGRFVVFESDATNLVAGDTDMVQDVFVRDRQLGTTERVSVSTAGAQANSHSGSCSISADGRFVVFSSGASTLVAGDTNATGDLFLRDRMNGTTERVSISSSGAQGDANSGGNAMISSDGRFVAFVSFASNLVAGDTNAAPDIFVRDRQSGTTERVSIGPGVGQGNHNCDLPSISSDGRFVAFESFASNLVTGDTNGLHDVFVRDRQAGTTERVSVSTSGAEGDSSSAYLSMSADGRFVSFHSLASTLVAVDTNGQYDVFVRDRGAPVSPSPYCFGDGTGTACPCGTGAGGHGCPSSVNSSGAILVASGNASLSNDMLFLLGSGMTSSACMYVQGTGQANVPFGDGLRCVAGAVTRLGLKLNAGGASQYPDTGDPTVSVKGIVTAPGTRSYQVWYRDAPVFCTAATFNLTNGWMVTWAQ